MKHDENKIIFQSEKGFVTYGNIVDALKKTEADQCDVLFVHSDISFGKVATGIKRLELKKLLVDALLETKVKTIIFPTFTFSFCNKEDYDIQNSLTAMGMLPEYVRKREDVYRTDDPILSVAIIGDKTGFEKMTGISSCGKGGIFHQLHNSGKKVKFLFFGTLVTKCFTFLHYVEEIKGVSYRYAKDFTGNVINEGVKREVTVEVYVRYKDVIPTLPDDFAEQLINRGIMKQEYLGVSSVSVVEEAASYEYICSLIDNNPYVFSILPECEELIKDYQYGNVVSM